MDNKEGVKEVKEGKYIPYFNKFVGMKPYLYIDEKEWKYVKDKFKEEDVKYSLAKVAFTYPLPYREISEKDAESHLKKLKLIKWKDNARKIIDDPTTKVLTTKGLTTKGLIKEGEWQAREGTVSYKYPLTIDGIQRYIGLCSTGNSASDYFHQVNRWAVDGSSHPGPQRTWSDMKYMITLMGAAYSLELTKIDKLNLRLMIAVRKYICSQFKPSVAKCIYDMYDAENILDFSAGWGDRLAGFYASTNGKFYLGIDPNTTTYPVYKEQAKFYEKRAAHEFLVEVGANKKTSEFICEPAEDFDYINSRNNERYDNFFDMCFTSPPYFDKERYSHDDTQSWKRYENIDKWNEGFLQCTLNKVWKTLKKGGRLLINISDVYAFDKRSQKKQWLQICDPMNDFISTLQGAEYVGCLGMQMAKRPNNTSKLDTTFCEPIWIWKKGR